MERKHQVFVSSTFKDLIEERKEVIHALLELDCIPAGMELFPATDEDAWTLIKEVIDDSDYYILIQAGKYGSLNNEGISYTEMEYDYAVSRGKPIISFLHGNMDDLKSGKVERSDEAIKLLQSFRQKAEQRHCKYWASGPDLGGKVSRSLILLKKKHPSDGWVPGRYAADQKLLTEMEAMRAKIAELEMIAISSADAPPANIEQLQHGSDTLPLYISLPVNDKGEVEDVKLLVSWDNLFRYAGSTLSGECNEEELYKKLTLAYYHSVPDSIKEFTKWKNITLPFTREDLIKTQFQALGLMEHGQKKRTASDSNTYWKLTSYGEKYLIQINAVKRRPKLGESIDSSDPSPILNHLATSSGLLDK